MEVVDIALIVALDEEYQTIRRTLGTTPTSSFERTHLFNLPIAKHPGKQVTMAVHVIGEMGLVPTTSATDSVLDRFNPSWLVSIGLSGQLSNDCYLGDVVLSTECDLAYSEARLSIDKTEFAGKIHEVLGLKDFVKAVDLSKYLQCRELHLPTAAQSELVQRRLWRKFPRVHAGITCSTDFVVDDPKRKSELLQKNRRFLCTDMESAAMVAAARRRGYGGRFDLPPTSRAKVKEVKSAHQENGGHEEEQVQRGTDHRVPQAGRGRDSGGGGLPQGRLQRRDVLQVALEVRRHGGV